ncbi:hypothetical protein K502DRAFT_362010 [Neoconidiobolus thromboides FSU 785]|nr:hypothetical protein K502DRAFT_362010 [Neoconidiobolus thromboides FSU 785]
MKFAKQLALRSIPTWAIYYIDYKLLKKAIKEYEVTYNDSVKSDEVKDDLMNEFKELLLEELNKVDDRYKVKENELRERLNSLKSIWSDEMTQNETNRWRQDFSKLLQQLEYLFEFTNTNITGFQKILKKFDKHIDTNIREDWWPLVTNCSFVASEKDESMLFEAKQVWRTHVPPAPLAPTEDIHPVEPVVPTVTNLDLDALPGDRISRLWVVVAEDGLSLPIKVPVIVAKGVKPGPVLGITAALHGNELNGIPLIHRLFREIKTSNLHGIIVAVPVANVPGYLTSQRTYDGQDLNRLMPGKKNGSRPQVYSYNLMDRIINKIEYLLDLHTASRGRVNSLYVRANMMDSKTRNMAQLQNPQIIVHNTSPDGSLRGAAMELGIPAITVEIGDPSRFQKRFIRSALMGVSNIMSHLQMINEDGNLTPSEYAPVICAKSYWIFASRGGILTVLPDVNTWVKKNEPIATLHNIFGNLEETYFAPEDGIVVGKNVDPVCQSGNRILHLGVVNSEFPTVSNDGHL